MNSQQRLQVLRWALTQYPYREVHDMGISERVSPVYQAYLKGIQNFKRTFELPDEDQSVDDIARWALTSRYLAEKSDEELNTSISRYLGFAVDEQIDEAKIVRTPDCLVEGKKYMLASNGYPLGKYMGSSLGPSHPDAPCGCNGKQILVSFESGNRDYTVFQIGLVACM